MTFRPLWIWLLALLLISLGLAIAHRALADQRVIYGSDGRVIGRSTTDKQGTTTLYGSDGRTVTRESNGTVYDARTGRVIAKEPKK